MRQLALHLAVVASALATPAAPVIAQDRDLIDDRALRQAIVRPQPPGREATRTAVEQYPVRGKVSLPELVTLSLKDGLLDVKAASDMPPAGQPVRVEVEGSTLTWAVNKRSVGQASTYVTVSCYDFAAAPDDEFWSVALTIRDSYISLTALTGDTGGLSVRLTQSAVATRRLRITVSERLPGGAPRAVFSASADTVDQLRRDNPEQVRKYLESPLRTITGKPLLKPGPADVYRIFETIQPDPEIAGRVMALLLRLDAESFKERERASADLAKLGPPAVLAVLRVDRSLFSAEVNTRLISFLAAHGNSTADAQAAAKDPHFLIDCLDDDDAKVRAAAKAALEKLLDRPVKFDPSLTGSDRLKAADAVRREMAPKTQRPADSTEAR